MTAKRKADIIEDRLAEIEMFYVVMDGKVYFSRDESWTVDYADAMQFPTADAARFEIGRMEGAPRVVGPCIEGEKP